MRNRKDMPAEKLRQYLEDRGLFGELNADARFRTILDELERTTVKSNDTQPSNNQDFLAKAALDLVELSSIQEIYDYVADTLYSLLEEKAIITVVDYDISKNKWKMMSYRGVDRIEKISALLGYDFRNMSGETDTRYFQQLKRGQLVELDFDLPGLTNNRLSESIGKQAKRLLSLERLYCITFDKNAQVFGNISIMPRKKNLAINTTLVEAFIGQVTAFVEKLNTKRILKEKEQKYRALFETSPDAICLTNNKNEFTQTNKSFNNLTGYSEKELLGKSFCDMGIFLIPDEDKPVFEKLTHHTLKDKEIQIRPKNGDTKNILISNSLIFIEEKKHSLSILTDISTLKNKEKELTIALKRARESDQLKSAFLTNISHEIRTPMNGIIGFIELLKMPEISEDEKREYLTIIENSGKRMMVLLNNLVEISLLKASEKDITISEFFLNDLIKQLKEDFKETANNKSVALKYSTALADGESQINNDPEIIRKTLTHLLDNAFKFTSEGSVEFGYYLNGKEIVFFVKDTGIGICKKMHKKIFEYFRQTEMDLNRKYEGAGLGLSLVEEYVKLLDGKLWLNSEQNKGTTFYFSISHQQY